MKQLIAFDLDGTLAESKQPLDREMGGILSELSHVSQICIISGGDWPQFKKQVVSRLPATAKLANFWIMPTTGTKLYQYDGSEWTCRYADLFTAEERDRIITEVQAGIERLGIRPAEIWGEQVEDRGSQITFSALGQEAPLGPKEEWDPRQEKRRRLKSDLQPRLPDLSVRIGGATSIDITRKGVDKAYGIRRLEELSGVPREAMLFFGDALYEGGNDAPVRDVAGIDSVQVSSIAETKCALQALIFCLR